MKYREFIAHKSQLGEDHGFDPVTMPGELFDFQRALVEWSTRKGRAAIWADCGLGKTPMQLAWADNVVRHTNGRVLILTPLAVGHQTVREGEKFGIGCARSIDGKPAGEITVTNYEKLHLFDPADYDGVVLDESSILKNFSGRRRRDITWFMRKMPFRLLCTATAAPNDYVEVGTSSEALGEMGHMDMLARFFKSTSNEISSRNNPRGIFAQGKFRFKRHAEGTFWRWVCSWARAIRRPSDLGFDDSDYSLPELSVREHVIEAPVLGGYLFPMPAVGLQEQREERRATIAQRCEAVAELLDGVDRGVAWCHLNDEGDRLEDVIDGAVQVAGKHSEEEKEERLEAFGRGEVRVLVTKPKLAGFGLNWQHCNRMTFFPSHSFEQYYQAVRRCWRFGQERPVRVDLITTESEKTVLANLNRKAEAAGVMFERLVAEMNRALRIETKNDHETKAEVPEWL